MLPEVTIRSLCPPTVPVRVTSNCVTVSVCSNETVWLSNSHVILGAGAPSDLQEMSARPPSRMTTGVVVSAVVLASSEKKSELKMKIIYQSPQKMVHKYPVQTSDHALMPYIA